ncbi:MAG: glycerol-3-phosphate responsive antiterminator [Oscillospiraceae bacterium]|nr:glycerol-3-phosphate responsive antiterminator [Oscillospiraceae bacterium]
MDSRHLLELLADNPIIAAVKDDQGLSNTLDSNVDVIFLLYGNVLNLPELVNRVHTAGKAAFVHLDLVDGLTNREISADFVARSTAAAGIISTKSPVIKRGRELGLVAIQRYFLLDSMALSNIERDLSRDAADLIEVLPGLMPKMIRRLVQSTGKPIIAGGLISDKEDVTGALGAGAVAVSTTNPAVWRM